MSILTPITKLAVLGAASGIIYIAASAFPFGNQETPVEPDFANPANVQLYKPKNEKGNIELYLEYNDGTNRLILPIKSGQHGPIVGNDDYLWSSMSIESKSGYVESEWNDLLIDSRKSILKGELEKMLENYGE